MTDIYRCNKCKLHVLSEELDLHSCLRMDSWLDFKFDENGRIVWLFDGNRWYPFKW